MKYIAYCLFHKCWFTDDTLKPKCQHMDKKHIKEKMKGHKQKCQYLIYIEKEVNEENEKEESKTIS